MNFSDTKLIVYLKTFSKDELNSFEKFLFSPYFKKDRELTPYFLILKEFHPEYSNKTLDEKYIFEKLFRGEKYSDKRSKNKIRVLSSNLLNSVEEYLFISSVRTKKVLRDRVIQDELINRNLPKYYKQNMPSVKSDLVKDEIETGLNSLERYHVELLNSFYFGSTLDFMNCFKSGFESVKIIAAYSLLDILRAAKTKFLTEKYRNIFTGDDFIENMLDKIPDMDNVLKLFKGTKEYVYLCFHYYTYKSITGNIDENYYKKAKNIFYENRSSISRHDKVFFYADLVNINNIGNSREAIQNNKEMFSLYKYCLEDKAYKISDNDFMQPDFYRNVIKCTEQLSEFDWAAEFVDKYSKELKPEFRDNMENFSMAVIYYGKGEFERSLSYVSEVKYDLVDFKLDIKVLMLKLFFEMDLTEQSYSLADSFRHYVNNNEKLTEDLRRSFLNFIKYYLKITELKIRADKNKILILKKEIANEKILFNSDWLLEILKKSL